jgi:winged helix DNA-binding protein
MAERVLTERALNRALLARQLLLERARLPIPRALERIGGIQNQYAPSGYVGLWTRLEGFERDSLTRALERRSVVQGTLMRETIHLVSRGDYRPLATAVRASRRAWALRVDKTIDERGQQRRAAELRAALAAGPRGRELDPLVRGHVMLWVDVVRVPPSGTWERRRADRYALAEDWLGLSTVTGAEDALSFLIRRYLGAFGPAAVSDIARWAGVHTHILEPVAGRMGLRGFREETGRALLDLPRAPLPEPETPAPVRFLPHFDSCLLVHARRTGLVPEKYRTRMFHTKNPFSVGAVLVDGRVAAAWSHRDGHIVVEPYEPLPPQVEEERERLEAFHA